MAKAEILAGHDPLGTQPVEEDGLDEGLGRQPHQCGIEVEEIEDIDPEIAQQLGLAAQGCEAGRGMIGLQHLARVRLEGDDAQRRASGARQGARGVEHCLMPAMNPVKVADCDRSAEPSARPVGTRPDYAHGGDSSTPDAAV
jgi:hypothetical protein